MIWYVYVAHFIAAVFAANGIPHFVAGVTGRRFPTPFASPPGRGLSSPVVNVVWAAGNFLVAWALLTFVSAPERLPDSDLILMALGFFMTSVALAAAFGRRSGDGG